MLVLEDLGELLQTEGYGTLGEDMFLGITRDEPDSQLVIVATGGYMLSSQLNDTKPTFQILVRDVSYGVGYQKIFNIFKYFNDSNHKTSPSGRKMIIKPIQPPFSLGEDLNKRSMFVFNISVVTSLN